MKIRIVLLLMMLGCCVWQGRAQETAVPDSTVRAVLAAGDSTASTVVAPKINIKAAFKPDPSKALLYALVPGLGQIYNRKYWKLPLVYGGLMGCFYAVTWNNKNYGDYSKGYQDIMADYFKYKDVPADQLKDDDFNPSWVNLLPASYDPKTYFKDTRIQEQLKRKKDSFRRYRDLSIIITVGVYAISVIDAYVDAQLFDFDISPDLSMRVEPVVTPKTSVTPASYGVNWSLKF